MAPSGCSGVRASSRSRRSPALWARVGLTTIAGLNRLNRGPTRLLTEIPVRLLYIVLQAGFEVLDRVFFDPREVLSHIVVARRSG